MITTVLRDCVSRPIRRLRIQRANIAFLVGSIFFVAVSSHHAASQSNGQWYRLPAPGDVQRVFLAPDSTLFACTNTGLYRENLHTGQWNFYSSADGFIGNDAHSIAPDSSGRLYFASTPVAIFNNGSFSAFSLDSVPGAFDVVVDRRGWLWCTFGDGVYRHTPLGWIRLSSADGIADGRHFALAVDSVGIVWCGGDNLISYFDTLGWHIEQTFQPGIRGNVTAISIANDKSLWIGTSQGYVGRRFNSSWRLVSPTYLDGAVTSITSQHDTVWIAATSLYRIIGSLWKRYTKIDGLAMDRVQSVNVDRWGRLWVGHPAAVLSIFEGTTWKTKLLKSALPDFHASSVAASLMGIVCAATENNGIALFDGTSWQTIHSGLPSDTINAVRFDHKGDLWICTPQGIGRYDGNTWRQYTKADGLPFNDIKTIAVSAGDSVWCGGNTSLAYFNGISWIAYSFPPTIAARQINNLAIDSAGSVWAATDSGVVKFDGSNFYHFYPITKHSGILSLAVDSRGLKWCGSDSAGAWLFNDTTWILVAWPNFEGTPTTALSMSGDNVFWFGSSFGRLTRFDGVSWSHFGEADGLARGTIRDIAFDRRGNTWFASGTGVTVYNQRGVVLSAPVTAGSQKPVGFVLLQNYPNPFNPSTTIRFSLPHRSYVKLSIFNVLAQRVTTLIDGNLDAGTHDIRFDATGLASGLYFYSLQAEGTIQTKKLIVIK